MIIKESTCQYLQLFSLLLLPWGLFFFEALASIVIIIFALPVLIFARQVPLDQVLRQCWPFLVIFAIILVSGFWSRDTDRWLGMLRVNLPYVMLPFSFYLWPQFLKKRRRLFQRQFIFAGAALTLYLIYKLFFHGEEILTGIREGGSFQMPVQHVRTSLFLAVAGLFGWDEWLRHRWNSRNSLLYGMLLLVVIAGIHLLAVRTGLALFYTGTLITFIFNKKFHTRQGLTWMVVFVVVVAVSLLTIPTIREKWAYFVEDFRNYESHSWWFYSDAVRWKSNLMGWEIFKASPWWGVGMGDLVDEMHLQFYLRENIRIHEYPHNLWITFLAGSGLVGFCVLNVALGQIFIQLKKHGELVYAVIIFIYMVSCLVETTLLTSLGAISFVVIGLLATCAYGEGDPHSRGQS